MLDFMDYIQLAFSDASGWNRDNSYSTLTDTAKALLDFSTPERLRVHLSSLSTPQFATAYTLGTVGLIDGSVSYLFSTIPLNKITSRSALIPLRSLVPGYRQIYPPAVPLDPGLEWTFGDSNNIGDAVESERKRKATLLHATLHLPPPTTLTALFLHRPSPTTKLSVALYSTQATNTSKSAPPQASLLTQLFHDTGKYSTEFLFSTDNALFGFRGLWNFGPDPREQPSDRSDAKNNDQRKKPSCLQSVALLSAGGEAYYSPTSSVIGLSTGVRFTTLPGAYDIRSGPGSLPSVGGTSGSQIPSPISTFPYTLTLTLTPLTGSLSTTYSLLASPNLALSSRFGFNVYSWESEMVAGCELWRNKKKVNLHHYNPDGSIDDLAWAKRKLGLLPPLEPTDQSSSSPSVSSLSSESVIKLRVDQSLNVRLLWEGRIKDLLVSAGVALGPTTPHTPSMSCSGGSSSKGYGWTGVGVSVLYSS
ncbi:Mitochondrial distribution and morphology protein 10 [Trichophyton interdigitale]|uniref:Mitochondrial distribution and morphology protein 10 n=1 Tax=Trichophyton interdigitale TaxID=101480 RepID=A0A9P4YHA1_9EURO|nr:Mitochondrial distribution and morphology protein 10 [Trichophyton interdigitale]KAF3896187.1 Mitochondrial distribution and morphology protein 10 [Trichophyton interdigitale]KAG8208273.1 Mitochondrial distribution and morphology protein 10 [Trichophyton interdigitale]